MDKDLKSLIAHAQREHDCRPGANSEEIAAAEARLGYSFTDDLRELLCACNGIKFWKSGEFPCRLLSASEINPVHLFLDSDEGPRGLIAILKQEADFVAIGLDRESKCYSQLVDCCHETYPYELFAVCNSIQGMLDLILESKGEEWIWPAARACGIDLADRTTMPNTSLERTRER